MGHLGWFRAEGWERRSGARKPFGFTFTYTFTLTLLYASPGPCSITRMRFQLPWR